MRKLLALTKRNLLEMLRDPLSLIFCLAFPIVMLVLMQGIFLNINNGPDNFLITNYASGICVFGYTFISMFVAIQISSDKNGSFIKRLNIAPMPQSIYYGSFVISATILAIAQTILFYGIALIFGFPFNGNLALSIIYLIPSALFYITLGILIGIICNNEKQTGPISSIFISMVGIFGGVFMPLSAITGTMRQIINALPFCHTVQIASDIQSIGAAAIYPHILYILGYSALCVALSLIITRLRHKR